MSITRTTLLREMASAALGRVAEVEAKATEVRERLDDLREADTERKEVIEQLGEALRRAEEEND